MESQSASRSRPSSRRHSNHVPTYSGHPSCEMSVNKNFPPSRHGTPARPPSSQLHVDRTRWSPHSEQTPSQTSRSPRQVQASVRRSPQQLLNDGDPVQNPSRQQSPIGPPPPVRIVYDRARTVIPCQAWAMGPEIPDPPPASQVRAEE
ncbi:hypothetical protein CALVIDRAFT_365602 [Calocera viscosa TUFC12733]|uniref:Uncharacterized protein n=1 Tax=Calocera viscosa (strain TUFC12733) TaxID=1330018 RepID=A0A167H2Y7_CALVF|nr:hypothetical protein CALVIDRAFT_365602 [Calocera viscosa TUFC12733]